MAIHRISICLSDIDQSRIVKDKNGKPWLKLTIFESIQQTRLDDNIEVLQSASLEEQEKGILQQRVGRGRTVSSVLK
jgi:hypothetical protein